MSRLPANWTLEPLHEVAEILDSRRIPINSKERQQRITDNASATLFPYYGATGQVGVIDGFLFEGEHVLIGEDGAPFLDPGREKAYLVSGRFWVNNHAHILKACASNRFLCHFLNCLDYSNHVTGTTRLKLTQSALRDIRVPFPPSREQFRIAAKIEELFSEIDKGVESLTTARDQLKVYRQAVLKHAFEGKLTADWRIASSESTEDLRLRLTCLAAARRQAWESPKNTFRRTEYREPVPYDTHDIPSVPAQWALISLDALSFHITSGSRDWTQYYGRGHSTFVMAQNVQPGTYATAFSQRVDPPKNNPETERTRVELNDLLVTIVGANTGNLCRFPIDSSTHYVCQSVALTRLVHPEYARFLELYFQAETGGLRQFNRYTYGAGRPHLSFEQVKQTVVPLPDRREAALLVERVNAKFDQLFSLEQHIGVELARVNALRQSILQKAFSGQLVPQDPNDEPASVLLERIKAEKERSADTKPKPKNFKAQGAAV